MNKQEIITIVKNTINTIDTSVFCSDEQRKGQSGIGSNQFRELASICRSAECYEEIVLLIQYNEAKDNGKSWSKKMKNSATLAKCIINGMEEIKKLSDEESCLDNLCLYFGYFYWNARIFAKKNSDEFYANKNNNNFKNDRNKTGFSNNNFRNNSGRPGFNKNGSFNK